eukprot:TRINITY_DN17380_c0_g1_i1.p1 TRINITY_DN17380_c0_g1~~TRINITY_DN17380_c0_g1_i1.p1  ORF type:complete len:163 (+),score=14.14 TRINITY_DN17380_c0_g1_i1:453-941(+)
MKKKPHGGSRRRQKQQKQMYFCISPAYYAAVLIVSGTPNLKDDSWQHKKYLKVVLTRINFQSNVFSIALVQIQFGLSEQYLFWVWNFYLRINFGNGKQKTCLNKLNNELLSEAGCTAYSGVMQILLYLIRVYIKLYQKKFVQIFGDAGALVPAVVEDAIWDE